MCSGRSHHECDNDSYTPIKSDCTGNMIFQKGESSNYVLQCSELELRGCKPSGRIQKERCRSLPCLVMSGLRGEGPKAGQGTAEAEE